MVYSWITIFLHKKQEFLESWNKINGETLASVVGVQAWVYSQGCQGRFTHCSREGQEEISSIDTSESESAHSWPFGDKKLWVESLEIFSSCPVPPIRIQHIYTMHCQQNLENKLMDLKMGLYTPQVDTFCAAYDQTVTLIYVHMCIVLQLCPALIFLVAQYLT